MKSKRADRFLQSKGFRRATEYSRDVRREIAEKAVELAEEDARERAVKAYCMTSRCLMIAAMRPPCEGKYCNGAMEFLKHYDNGTFDGIICARIQDAPIPEPKNR